MSQFGRFAWRELVTSDVAAAKRFYGEVFGWSSQEVPMGGMNYTMFAANGVDVAGAMPLPMKDVPPHWYGYVTVEDVDAGATRAAAAGGQLVMPAQDAPGIGRFAVALDDQGAVFGFFKPEDAPTAPGAPKVGEFCWESYGSNDHAKAIAFYTKVLGWKTGPFGGMTTFGIGDGPANQVADLSPAPPGVPPHWMSHVVVDSLAPARERVKRLGGSILMDAIVVPSVGTFAVVRDPQGATISLFQPEAR
jgi:predicted enzyme related to lactoylglutathione lyase